ncbi:hypothetical protein [Paenibacillus oryzisoli]|nr:hypothetical protein [Paenibacillus oryzisoli]
MSIISGFTSDELMGICPQVLLDEGLNELNELLDGKSTVNISVFLE